MKPLAEFPISERAAIRGVLTDIDDTLTSHGKLTADAFVALEQLQRAGLLVIPVTGRPAGWCDHIARMWPVDGVVGENGAFYFRYNAAEHRLQKQYMLAEGQRRENRERLARLKQKILAEVPGTAVASDQYYREADVAIDYCEDVPPLSSAAVDRIVGLAKAAGATAKISSIHVNVWFGHYDKLGMTRRLLADCFDIDLEASKHEFVFIGDSPNDAPMFLYFPNTVGVANVRDFDDRLAAKPAYVTAARSGAGFAELAAALLAVRS